MSYGVMMPRNPWYAPAVIALPLVGSSGRGLPPASRYRGTTEYPEPAPPPGAMNVNPGRTGGVVRQPRDLGGARRKVSHEEGRQIGRDLLEPRVGGRVGLCLVPVETARPSVGDDGRHETHHQHRDEHQDHQSHEERDALFALAEAAAVSDRLTALPDPLFVQECLRIYGDLSIVSILVDERQAAQADLRNEPGCGKTAACHAAAAWTAPTA